MDVRRFLLEFSRRDRRLLRHGARGRHLAVRVFVASIVLNALLAIAVLLAGDFGSTESKILFSSLSLTGAALLALACEAGREGRRLGYLPPVGTLAAIAGFALLLAGIWSEHEIDWLQRLMGTFITLAVVVAILSLTSRASLAARFGWTFAAAAVLASLLGAMLVSAIWGEWESEWFWRLFGVTAVALAAFTIVIPVLHRISGREPAVRAGGAGGVAYCPSCGRPHAAAPEEETTCLSCGVRFAVRFLAPAAGGGKPSVTGRKPMRPRATSKA